MFGKLVLFFALATVAYGLKLDEGKPYLIVNAADRSFLHVVSARELCKPMSPVTTVASAEDTDGVVWHPNWWGNQELFGIHFDTARSLNGVTFEAPYTCYPVYNQYDLVEIHGGVQLQARGVGCLTANGVGQLVDFQACDETKLEQVWYFKAV